MDVSDVSEEARSPSELFVAIHALERFFSFSVS